MLRLTRRASVLAGLAMLVAAVAGAAALFGAALFGAWVPAGAGTSAAVAAPLGLPLVFERNVGQADPAVRFLAHAPHGTLYLTRSEAIVALLAPGDRPGARTDVLRMRLSGAAPSATVTGDDPQTATVNYLVGDRASRWRRQVPTYGRVTYRDVYRGIDLAYHASGGRLEYDFDVAPRADPGRIGLQLGGARALSLDAAGRLHVALAHRTLIEDAPHVYQLDGARREAVSGRFVLRGARGVGFAVGRYDHARPLVIDPTIDYLTYFGASANDVGTSIAVDRAGNAYVAGSTTSPDLRLRRPLERRNHGHPIDAFVAKIDPRGRLVYATYLGGTGYTDARGIAVDAAGDAYVTGATGSRDFPTRRAIQAGYGGGPFDAYVTKLDRSGSRLVYSTYNGGPFNDRGYAIAVQPSGLAVAVGRTAHDSFPTAGRISPSPEGGAFVTKIAPSGRRVIYSTVLGGHDPSNTSNTAFAVALDRHANAYVTGITGAPDFPTVKPFQARYRGSLSNAFVTKINAGGSAVVYSSFLGGSVEDEGLGIAVDRAGAAYVTGHTSSKDFPIIGPALPVSGVGDGSDAFVTKVAPAGSSLAYSEIVSGRGEDTGNAIAVNRYGNAFVAGTTTSPDLATTPGAVQRVIGGSSDAFVIALGRGGSVVSSWSYLGGNGADLGLGLALDRLGDVYLTGQTSSTDLPVVNAVQGPPAKRAADAGGGGSAFVVKIAPGPAPPAGG